VRPGAYLCGIGNFAELRDGAESSKYVSKWGWRSANAAEARVSQIRRDLLGEHCRRCVVAPSKTPLSQKFPSANWSAERAEPDSGQTAAHRTSHVAPPRANDYVQDQNNAYTPSAGVLGLLMLGGQASIEGVIFHVYS
jgi:hypothetical protein